MLQPVVEVDQQPFGRGQIRLEAGEITVVDSDQGEATNAQHTVHFGGVVNLHQHGEAQSRRSLVEITKILIRKDGSNQQHRVSPGRPGLEQLIRAQHKLLAEQR